MVNFTTSTTDVKTGEGKRRKALETCIFQLWPIPRVWQRGEGKRRKALETTETVQHRHTMLVNGGKENAERHWRPNAPHKGLSTPNGGKENAERH